MFDANIGNGGGFFASAQGVFAVVLDFEAGDARGAETMHQGGQRTVALAGNLYWLAIAQQVCATVDGSVTARSLETLELPRCRPLDVFAPKHCFEFRAADLAAKPVHLVVSNGAEFPLHVLGQLNPKFSFQKVGHAAFAGLAVHAYDLAVFAANVGWVNREVGDVPMLLASIGPLGKPFADGGLVRTTNSGKDQRAC